MNKKQEIWKDVPDYEGLYQASSMGRVRSMNRTITYVTGRIASYRGRILKHKPKKHGYCTVYLCDASMQKEWRVHRLIMHTFEGEALPGIMVHHKNGVKADNRLENLKYVTNLQNVHLHISKNGVFKGEMHPSAKITDKEVDAIRLLYATGKYSQDDIADFIGIGQSHVQGIVHFTRRPSPQKEK